MLHLTLVTIRQQGTYCTNSSNKDIWCRWGKGLGCPRVPDTSWSPDTELPYDCYCADKDLPHNRLSCCIIKCAKISACACCPRVNQRASTHATKTTTAGSDRCGADDRVLEFCALSPCAVSFKERFSLTEKAHGIETPPCMPHFLGKRQSETTCFSRRIL